MDIITETLSNMSIEKIPANIFVFLIDNCIDVYQEIYIVPLYIFTADAIQMMHEVGSKGIYHFNFDEFNEEIKMRDLHLLFSNYDISLINKFDNEQYVYDQIFKYFCVHGIYEYSAEFYKYYMNDVQTLSQMCKKIQNNSLDLNSFNLEKYNIKYIFNSTI
jgi:hypothetical protein